MTVPPTDEWQGKLGRAYLSRSIKNMGDAADELTSEGDNIIGWFMDYDPPKGEGFMWCEHTCKKKLMNHRLVKLDGHTGASMAICMRQLQFIVRNGFAKWQEREMKNAQN